MLETSGRADGRDTSPGLRLLADARLAESAMELGAAAGVTPNNEISLGAVARGSGGKVGSPDTTFQLDEDAVQTMRTDDPVILRTKKRRSRRKRLSESLSQPRFSDNYRCNGENFLGCGSYGSVYTCSSLRSSERSKSRTNSQSVNLDGEGTLGGGGSNGSSRQGRGSGQALGAQLEQEEGEEFAVKVIDKKGHSRTRLFSEMEILHQCKDQPNIVQMLDFYEEDQMFFLIFEKMNGGALVDHLNNGPISERDASLVTRDIATALAFLHSKGIAHRDLKPANVLCEYAHSIAPVKICDFDLASAPWIREATSLTNYSPDSIDLVSPVGSAEYMAPEVVSVFLGSSDATAYDKRCDLWSLGVILYIMLCGYPPFVGRCGYPCGWEQGENCTECQSLLMDAILEEELTFPSQEWSRVSPAAVELVKGLLERDPDRRMSAEAVLNHEWLESASVKASNPIPLNASRRKYIMLCGYPPFVGRCGYPCGWEQGENCTECQSLLMDAILEEELTFPSQEWSRVSPAAVELVKGLLERDPDRRMSAEAVLNHEWLESASVKASNPIPLNASRRKISASTPAQLNEYRTGPLESSDQRQDDDDINCSPGERHRLGTEDSGFGGDAVPNVVEMLLDAATEPETDFATSTANGTLVGGLKNKRMPSEMSDQQFDMSDDESLFSSGYGVSLDLPSGDLVDAASIRSKGHLVKTSSSETDFGFESVNKSEIENEMSKAEAGSEPTKAALLVSLGLRSKGGECSRVDPVSSLSDDIVGGMHIRGAGDRMINEQNAFGFVPASKATAGAEVGLNGAEKRNLKPSS